jgi:hypothetical protein
MQWISWESLIFTRKIIKLYVGIWRDLFIICKFIKYHTFVKYNLCNIITIEIRQHAFLISDFINITINCTAQIDKILCSICYLNTCMIYSIVILLTPSM